MIIQKFFFTEGIKPFSDYRSNFFTEGHERPAQAFNIQVNRKFQEKTEDFETEEARSEAASSKAGTFVPKGPRK